MSSIVNQMNDGQVVVIDESPSEYHSLKHGEHSRRNPMIHFGDW